MPILTTSVAEEITLVSLRWGLLPPWEGMRILMGRCMLRCGSFNKLVKMCLVCKGRLQVSLWATMLSTLYILLINAKSFSTCIAHHLGYWIQRLAGSLVQNPLHFPLSSFIFLYLVDHTPLSSVEFALNSYPAALLQEVYEGQQKRFASSCKNDCH